MTTYTYLTTVVQNKRSAISTFETIVSVVTTESLTNLYDTDVIPDLNPTKVRFGTPVGRILDNSVFQALGPEDFSFCTFVDLINLTIILLKCTLLTVVRHLIHVTIVVQSNIDYQY